MLALFFTAASLVGAAPNAPMLFDAGAGRWLVLSRSGEQLQLVSQVADRRPTDAAISPDGKGWAFIADEQLFVWREGWKAARTVPRAGDVLQAPAFSLDGKWLYFIQNDYPTMKAKDAPMRYSQVWRVAAEGGKPQKLTRTPGCRMWPAPMAGGGTLVTHATCRGGRGLDLLTARGIEEPLLATDFEHGEAVADPRGERIAFARDGQGTELYVLELKTKKTALWARVPWRTSRLRPAFSDDGTTLWIQNQEGVWRVAEAGAVTQHLAFANVEGKR